MMPVDSTGAVVVVDGCCSGEIVLASIGPSGMGRSVAMWPAEVRSVAKGRLVCAIQKLSRDRMIPACSSALDIRFNGGARVQCVFARTHSNRRFRERLLANVAAAHP